jgi:phage virion morphogenesis protein
MTGARTEIKGKDAVLAQLAKAVTALAEPKPLFEDIGAMLRISTDGRFENEKDPDGNPWPQSLRALSSGGKTLTDTARLVGSITHEASNDGVAIGTNVIYAAIHQMGGTIKAKTSRGLRFRVGGNKSWVQKMSVDIPQRAFLGVDGDDEKAIIALSEDYITQALGGK